MLRLRLATYLFVVLSFLACFIPRAMQADSAGKVKDRLQNAALVTKEAMRGKWLLMLPLTRVSDLNSLLREPNR